MGAPVTRAVTFKLQPRRQTTGLRNRGGFFFPEPTRDERPESQLFHVGAVMAISESMHAKTLRPPGGGGFPAKDLSRPYRLAAHPSGPHATRPVRVSDTVTIGGAAITVIAGPCSVESVEMIISVANRVKSLGAVMLRGGAFKPRTSPYSFT